MSRRVRHRVGLPGAARLSEPIGGPAHLDGMAREPGTQSKDGCVRGPWCARSRRRSGCSVARVPRNPWRCGPWPAGSFATRGRALRLLARPARRPRRSHSIGHTPMSLAGSSSRAADRCGETRRGPSEQFQPAPVGRYTDALGERASLEPTAARLGDGPCWRCQRRPRLPIPGDVARARSLLSGYMAGPARA